MAIARVEILVEEPSMEAALRMLLPRIIGSTEFEVHPHQGKAALLRKLPDRLRGYSKWIPDNWCIVVVVDRDREDCQTLKSKLEDIAAQQSLPTRSRPLNGSYKLVNRLAIEELEAWYFGDWHAVRAAYPGIPATIPNQAKYRNPDAIVNTWEAFESILQQAGYFKGGLNKVEAARAVAAHMDTQRNSSQSFQVFRNALAELTVT